MHWQNELAKNVRDVEGLLPYLRLSPEEQTQMAEILDQFPLSVPEYYLSLINFNDPADPIRKMCIPSIAETDLSGSFDTSGEGSNTVLDGMQHKYAQTAMILSTNQCAMYCRHCFRKRLVGLSDDEIGKNFTAMRDYLLAHPEITNVLVSGGDALLNSNDRLRGILDMLADIDHLDLIRLGTRVPVVFPQRITGDPELIAMLDEYNRKKQLFLITHFNHPRELSGEAIAAIKAVQAVGIPVKNQTVFLRGVNDDAAVLGGLFRELTRQGVVPYYLFQCRPVSGVKSQFQVPFLRGWEILREATALQNGLGKSYHFCMSHETGKIEILGKAGADEMVFQYHEAKDENLLGRIFSQKVEKNQAWLEEIAL